ncbi:MAG: alcohol dehydrogenase catalytic domain-containing protein [Desulfatirhabdiaceae bacterium]
MDMKCVMVDRIGGFEITRVPVKAPLPDEVQIRVEVTGLCRTDLKLIRVGHRDLVLPRIPGEEVVGVVCETGAGVKSVNTGDRVYVYPGVWCGSCPSCRIGAENLCRKMQIMGFHRDGGFARFVTAPVRSVIPVPDGLAADLAVFAEPLSCCLNALELGQVEHGKTVAIWGAGPAGTLLARAAESLGAKTFSIDPDSNRCKQIQGYDACPDRYADVCIVAVGSVSAYETALSRLGPRGRLVVFSGLHPTEDKLPVSFNQLHYHEQTIVGAYGCCYRHGEQALERIASGAVRVSDLISHRMALDDLNKALSLVENRQCMKILLYPD